MNLPMAEGDLDQMAIEVGKVVAKSLLLDDDVQFRNLEKQLNELNQASLDKDVNKFKDVLYDESRPIWRIFTILVNSNYFSLGSVTDSKKTSICNLISEKLPITLEPQEMEAFKNVCSIVNSSEYNKKYKGHDKGIDGILKNLRDHLPKSLVIKIFLYYPFWYNFYRSEVKFKGKYSFCIYCNRKLLLFKHFKPRFRLNQSNYSDYKLEGTNSVVCFSCYLFSILANFFPTYIKTSYLFFEEKKKKIKYKYLILSKHTPYSTLFDSSFVRWVKKLYINLKILNERDPIYILFYQPGKQNANPTIYSFLYVDKLINCLWQLVFRDYKSINKFKKIFLNGQKEGGSSLIPFIIKSEGLGIYLESLSYFMKDGKINNSMLKLFISGYRYSDNKYAYFAFLDFVNFVKTYVGVCPMEKDINEKEIVEKGAELHRYIFSSVTDGLNEADKKRESERTRKYLLAKTAPMELSTINFVEGLNSLIREFGIYGFDASDMSSIADSQRKRYLFILGLLAGTSKPSESSNVNKDEVKE